LNALLRLFIRYASANVMGMLGLSCYILADTFFVAQRLGANGLTALNLAIPVYSLIHGVGLMLGAGGATRYTLARGQQEERAANHLFTHTLLLAACWCSAFILMGCFGSSAVTRLMGADDQVFDMTHTYLKVLLLFSPVFLANDILLSFVRSDGAPQLTMAAMLAGSFANILLDYVLMFMLNLGIFGAVLATGLAPLISMGVLLPHLLRGRFHFRLAFGKFCFSLWRKIASSGLPALITELSSGVVMIVFNLVILQIAGNLGVAAYGVVANLALVVMAIYTGVAQGIQPLFSQHLSSAPNLRTLLRYGLFTVLGLSLAIYGSFFIAATPIAAAFNSQKDAALQALAVQGLRLYFTGCAFAGVNILLCAYFPAIDRALPAQVISLLRGVVLIVPLAFAMAWAAGMTGLWLAFPLAEGLTLLASLFFLLHKKQEGR